MCLGRLRKHLKSKNLTDKWLVAQREKILARIKINSMKERAAKLHETRRNVPEYSLQAVHRCVGGHHHFTRPSRGTPPIRTKGLEEG